MTQRQFCDKIRPIFKNVNILLHFLFGGPVCLNGEGSKTDNMRVLALDVGTKTIGVAVSDELKISSNGVKKIDRKDFKNDLNEIKKILDQYKPTEIVVGVPYREDGSLGARGIDIKKFAKKIENSFKIPVVYFDESYSTVIAERALIEADVSRKKRKKLIDKMAAVVILQDYLESYNLSP